MCQTISYSTTGESKNAREGRKIKIYCKQMQSTSHTSSLHTHSQDLTWQECQAKEEAPHLGAFLSTSKIIHPNLNG